MTVSMDIALTDMLLRYGLLCIRAKLGPRETTICLQDTVFHLLIILCDLLSNP